MGPKTKAKVKRPRRLPVETTLGKAADLFENEPPDLGIVGKPIETSLFGLHEILKMFQTGSNEVKAYARYECEIMYECRMCRNIFRSFANFVLHKRNYCRDSYQADKDSENNYEIICDDIKTIPRERSSSPVKERVEGKQTSKGRVPLALRRLNTDLVTHKIAHFALSEDISKEVRNYEDRQRRNSIILEPMPNNSNGVFQTFTKTTDKEKEKERAMDTDYDDSDDEDKEKVNEESDVDKEEESMRNEVMELEGLLDNDEAVLKPDGSIDILQTVDLHKNKPDLPKLNLICPVCKLTFATKKTLSFHVKYKHNGSRVIYPCPVCKDTFANAWCVFRHLYKVHRKTTAQIRRLRDQIHESAIRSKEAEVKRPKNLLKDLSKENIVDENQKWMVDLEGLSDLQRCKNCGKRFERMAALFSHVKMCKETVFIEDNKSSDSDGSSASVRKKDTITATTEETTLSIQGKLKGSNKRKPNVIRRNVISADGKSVTTQTLKHSVIASESTIESSDNAIEQLSARRTHFFSESDSNSYEHINLDAGSDSSSRNSMEVIEIDEDVNSGIAKFTHPDQPSVIIECLNDTDSVSNNGDDEIVMANIDDIIGIKRPNSVNTKSKNDDENAAECEGNVDTFIIDEYNISAISNKNDTSNSEINASSKENSSVAALENEKNEITILQNVKIVDGVPSLTNIACKIVDVLSTASTHNKPKDVIIISDDEDDDILHTEYMNDSASYDNVEPFLTDLVPVHDSSTQIIPALPSILDDSLEKICLIEEDCEETQLFGFDTMRKPITNKNDAKEIFRQKSFSRDSSISSDTIVSNISHQTEDKTNKNNELQKSSLSNNIFEDKKIQQITIETKIDEMQKLSPSSNNTIEISKMQQTESAIDKIEVAKDKFTSEFSIEAKKMQDNKELTTNDNNSMEISKHIDSNTIETKKIPQNTELSSNNNAIQSEQKSDSSSNIIESKNIQQNAEVIIKKIDLIESSDQKSTTTNITLVPKKLEENIDLIVEKNDTTEDNIKQLNENITNQNKTIEVAKQNAFSSDNPMIAQQEVTVNTTKKKTVSNDEINKILPKIKSETSIKEVSVVICIPDVNLTEGGVSKATKNKRKSNEFSRRFSLQASANINDEKSSIMMEKTANETLRKRSLSADDNSMKNVLKKNNEEDAKSVLPLNIPNVENIKENSISRNNSPMEKILDMIDNNAIFDKSNLKDDEAKKITENNIIIDNTQLTKIITKKNVVKNSVNEINPRVIITSNIKFVDGQPITVKKVDDETKLETKKNATNNKSVIANNVPVTIKSNVEHDEEQPSTIINVDDETKIKAKKIITNRKYIIAKNATISDQINTQHDVEELINTNNVIKETKPKTRQSSASILSRKSVPTRKTNHLKKMLVNVMPDASNKPTSQIILANVSNKVLSKIVASNVDKSQTVDVEASSIKIYPTNKTSVMMNSPTSNLQKSNKKITITNYTKNISDETKRLLNNHEISLKSPKTIGSVSKEAPTSPLGAVVYSEKCMGNVKELEVLNKAVKQNMNLLKVDSGLKGKATPQLDDNSMNLLKRVLPKQQSEQIEQLLSTPEGFGKRIKLDKSQCTLTMKATNYMNIDRLMCIPCKSHFESKESLFKHMAQHFHWYMFQCSKCTYMCYDKITAIQHVQQQHNESPPFDNMVLPIPNWKTVMMSSDYVKIPPSTQITESKEGFIIQSVKNDTFKKNVIMGINSGAEEKRDLRPVRNRIMPVKSDFVYDMKQIYHPNKYEVNKPILGLKVKKNMNSVPRILKKVQDGKELKTYVKKQKLAKNYIAKIETCTKPSTSTEANVIAHD